MICASAVVTIPSNLERVVCGFLEVMLILAPTMALTSVDLPTFGRPTIATWPQRNARWRCSMVARLVICAGCCGLFGGAAACPRPRGGHAERPEPAGGFQ